MTKEKHSNKIRETWALEIHGQNSKVQAVILDEI